MLLPYLIKQGGSWWRSFRGGDTIFEKGKENRIWPIDLYLKKVLEELEKGKELAIATIINAKGSTPRDIGAKMVVLADGSIYGTIGGGGFRKTYYRFMYRCYRQREKFQYSSSLEQGRGVGDDMWWRSRCIYRSI